MYLLWSNSSIDWKHCFVFENTIQELKLKFKEFCEKNNEDYLDYEKIMDNLNPNADLTINYDYCINKLDKNKIDLVGDLGSQGLTGFINFFGYHNDLELFVRKINLESDKPIYIVEYIEDGEGQSYHKATYIYYMTSLDDVKEIVESTYNEECEEPTETDFEILFDKLKKTGSCEIENPITYCCGFKLYTI